MFYRANKLCKVLATKGIDYDCNLQMGKHVESMVVKFGNKVFFEDEEGFCYFKVINPLMFQIIDYIDLDAPDYPR